MRAWYVLERKLCRFLLLISGLTLAFMLVFTFVDVVLRAFGRPIQGDYEIISFLGAVVVGFAMPYTSLLKGHVYVDFLLEKLPKHVGDWMQVATRILATLFFLWVSWNFVIMSLDLVKSHEVTQVFRLPYYPIPFALAFCCIIQCLTLVLQIPKIVSGHDE